MTLRKLVLTLGCFALALVAACGSTPPAEPHSCMVGDVCVDYLFSSAEYEEVAHCSRSAGSYSTSVACPTEGRVARCTVTDGDGNYVQRTSHYAPWSVVTVRAICPPSAGAIPGATYELEEN